ncbi:PAS domain-containing protein [Candidatus Wolfebacteria bacterium]|nr:PAS domain-containing protein [Candidatus Wolfebacteria bacterium]
MDNTDKEHSFLKREQLGAIISSIGEGLLLVDKSYKIVLLNPKAGELLGVAPADVLGRDLRTAIRIFRGDDYLAENEGPLLKVYQDQKPVTINLEDNFYYQSTSGKKFPIASVTTPFIDEGRIIGAVVVFRDVTREKSLDEAKSHFLSIAAHQLRTPLTSIRWYTEILSSGDAGVLNNDQKSFLNQVYKATLRLINTIDLVLALTRVEAGQIKMQNDIVDLKKLTDDILNELEPSISEKKVKIEIKSAPKEEIATDASMLRLTITNLLTNAIRYSHERGSIEIKIESKPQEITYSVTDNGIGVPSHQQNRIFEKFFRADNAIVKSPDGDGLGLSLAKKLVELGGGRINFESRENKGSTFFFSIPKKS